MLLLEVSNGVTLSRVPSRIFQAVSLTKDPKKNSGVQKSSVGLVEDWTKEQVSPSGPICQIF